MLYFHAVTFHLTVQKHFYTQSKYNTQNFKAKLSPVLDINHILDSLLYLFRQYVLVQTAEWRASLCNYQQKTNVWTKRKYT